MPGFLQRSEERFPDRLVREILAQLNPVVHAVAPQDPVAHALRMMAEHDIGLVLVLEGERLAGVLSERDLARHAGRAGTVPLGELRVADLMTAHVATIAPDEPLGRCIALMDERGVRHLPVMDGGRVIAVVSVRDLLRAAVAHHRKVLAEVDHERLAAFQSTY
jgi:CBS domain-containing protein